MVDADGPLEAVVGRQTLGDGHHAGVVEEAIERRAAAERSVQARRHRRHRAQVGEVELDGKHIAARLGADGRRGTVGLGLRASRDDDTRSSRCQPPRALFTEPGVRPGDEDRLALEAATGRRPNLVGGKRHRGQCGEGGCYCALLEH